MDKADPGFTATATAISGRNDHMETGDRAINANVSVLKELSGQAHIACSDLDEYLYTEVRSLKPKTGGARS